MKMINFKTLFWILLFESVFFVSSCGKKSVNTNNQVKVNQASVENSDSTRKYLVTFIELGSVKCIPCQQMQAVMKSVETKYGKEVKIDFYDVWTEAGKPYGVKYGIDAIPTQIFLDETGKEYYRHVGFFPEEELVKILQMKGVKTK